jgi:addiction module HigA family antidote
MSNWSTIRITTEQEERPMMKNPVHPGQILREDVLAEIGLSVSEATSRLGISRVALSRVLHGHARISSNLAVRLEEAGVGTARAWLAMQVSYVERGPTSPASSAAVRGSCVTV